MDDEPATEILDATYRALYAHGFAELTPREIAAGADTSKASIHDHDEDRDRLFVAFPDFLYERYRDAVEATTGDTPRERLDSLLERHLLADGRTEVAQ